MAFEYTFFGKIIPERTNVQIPTVNLTINNPDAKIQGNLAVSILLSQITAKFISETIIDNFYALKNIIEDAIRVETDTLSFFLDCGYDLDLITMVDSTFEHNIIFGAGLGEPISTGDNLNLKFYKTLELFSDERGAFLQRCFGDYREAIRTIKDTGFFCYRSIESLRQYFVYQNNNCSDKDSWNILRTTLNIDRTEIDYIKSFADIVRHGGAKFISEEERINIIKTTKRIILSFIIYFTTESINE